MAADKAAPSTIAQLVMWPVASKLEWATIEELSKKWANGHELSLAREFAENLDTLPSGETASLLCEIKGGDAAQAAALTKALDGQIVLGLPVKSTVPARPDSPAVACKVELKGTAGKLEAQVHLAISDGDGSTLDPDGPVPRCRSSRRDGKLAADKFADSLGRRAPRAGW